MTSMLLVGCGEEFILAPCPSVKPIKKVEKLSIVPNKDGTLGRINTLRAKRLVDKLRISEDYYFRNTTIQYEESKLNATYKIF